MAFGTHETGTPCSNFRDNVSIPNPCLGHFLIVGTAKVGGRLKGWDGSVNQTCSRLDLRWKPFESNWNHLSVFTKDIQGLEQILTPLPLYEQCFCSTPVFSYPAVNVGLNLTTFCFHVVTTVNQSHSDEVINQGDIIKEKPHPNHVPSGPSVNSDRHPTYTWTKSGYTECSTTCGTGRIYT